MTAKELFAVVVRALGLVLLVGGLLAFADHVINQVMTPYPLPDEVKGMIVSGILAGAGLFLLLATNWIVRLVYGKSLQP